MCTQFWGMVVLSREVVGQAWQVGGARRARSLSSTGAGCSAQPSSTHDRACVRVVSPGFLRAAQRSLCVLFAAGVAPRLCASLPSTALADGFAPPAPARHLSLTRAVSSSRVCARPQMSRHLCQDAGDDGAPSFLRWLWEPQHAAAAHPDVQAQALFMLQLMCVEAARQLAPPSHQVRLLTLHFAAHVVPSFAYGCCCCYDGGGGVLLRARRGRTPSRPWARLPAGPQPPPQARACCRRHRAQAPALCTP